MSRLDGNGRWQTKMLLTEHQEQYEKRRETPSGYAKPEELKMIRDSIMLPHMLTLSNKSLEDLRFSKNLYRKYFERFVQEMMNRISRDLSKLQRDLRERNIKVFDDETRDGIIYYRYLCRGYEDKFGIVRETLRAEISIRLAQYASDVWNLKE